MDAILRRNKAKLRGLKASMPPVLLMRVLCPTARQERENGFTGTTCSRFLRNADKKPSLGQGQSLHFKRLLLLSPIVRVPLLFCQSVSTKLDIHTAACDETTLLNALLEKKVAPT